MVCETSISMNVYVCTCTSMYCIAGNFHRCKILQKCLQTLQKKFSQFFVFTERMLWPSHPLSWWPHPLANRYLKTKQRSKLVQHRPSLPLMWRPSQLRKYYDCCRGWETGLLSRKIQHCWSQLWQLKRVFSRVGILYSSRLILLYCLLFRGQTDCRDRLIPRPRPTFCRLPYCKQRKAGRGLGTRLL